RVGCPRRWAPAVALAREHAVAGAVADAGDPLDPAVGELVQLAALDAIDAAVGADPEVAARVLFDGEHAVVIEAVDGVVVDEAAVLEPAQSFAVGPDPERAVRVF